MANALSTDHSQAKLEDEGIGGGTGSSRADRLASFSPADFPSPTGTEEEWRFTPMKRVAPFLAQELEAEQIEVEAVSGRVDVVSRDEWSATVGAPEDRSSALAWQAATKTHVVTLESDSPDTMLRIDAGEGMHAAHLAIVAAEGARGTVVVEHSGTGDLTETIEVDVADRAEITVVSVQEAERTARHFSNQRLRVGRDSKLRHIVVTLGGDVVRVCTSAQFTAPGGDIELLGAYITESGEHHEHRLFVDHDPANCVSRATYKGALQGDDAHAVWIGDVLIRKTAVQTDTYELNRNLVLTKGAYADSVPNLEIETGEIAGAGHASATGRFDEEQLFYLRARGIPEDVARRLVVRGFFAELIDSIGVESVQDKLMAAIERELDLAQAASKEAE
ncbi:MAG: Fe-S cluster assembly protein SufD [Actinomycetaceae bacterium]|nr:Fe-S cluster assembly protein SufD [Actinomycetaceae bacterium]